ncbi:MAG: DJ-1/PfpI family protein [Treponema sp.]
MKKVFLFISDGFEEVEAITPLDYLRRCGAETVVVGIGGKAIKSSRSLSITCDFSWDEFIAAGVPLEQCARETALVVLPGGLPNSRTLGEHTGLRDFVKTVQNCGGIVAAICAAPVLTLGVWGMLNGKQYTCYPGMGEELPTPPVKDARVIRDGAIITACAAGAAEEFSFMLVEVLYGSEKLRELKTAIAAR